MIAFSVAPTETEGKFILLPFKPLGAEACIYPFLIFILAPSFFNAKRWRSTGLVPMAQPPGKEIFALLYFAKRGPKTNTPALIVLTNL